MCPVLLVSAGDPHRAQSSRRPQGGALSTCAFPAQSFGNRGWATCGMSFSVCPVGGAVKPQSGAALGVPGWRGGDGEVGSEASGVSCPGREQSLPLPQGEAVDSSTSVAIPEAAQGVD